LDLTNLFTGRMDIAVSLPETPLIGCSAAELSSQRSDRTTFGPAA
jgi:hypothetical protein